MLRPSSRPSIRLLTLSFVTFAASVAGALPTQTRQGLVVAAHPLAAQAGAQILAQGGNAHDALVATAFALGVVEPHSSGLGGGGFALLYDAKTKQVTALDFREVAPQAATPALFEKDGVYDPNLSRFGGRSVGVIATQPTVDGGALTACGMKKAARFARFCDSFNLPIVTLVDSTGFGVANAFGQAGLAKAGAALLGANVHPEIYVPGSPPKGETSTTEKGDGVYEISQVNFPAAGEYHITFHVTHHDKGIHDHATFRVVIK